MNLPEALQRSDIKLAAGELEHHVQVSLDDTNRDLAWIRTGATAFLFSVLAAVNYLTLPETSNLQATLFALAIVVAFAGLTCYHRFVDYPSQRTNGLMFLEVCVLQADFIAFSVVTDGMMGGFGLYVMIVAVGIFMTSRNWIVLSVVVLSASWLAAVLYRGEPVSATREGLMMVTAIFCAWLFYTMRIRAGLRLGEHQLFEQKYKEGLEQALREIDTLSGLLPICAQCKNIKDESGDWARIETYVAARSDVEFTHSLCPSCQDELYPDLKR